MREKLTFEDQFTHFMPLHFFFHLHQKHLILNEKLQLLQHEIDLEKVTQHHLSRTESYFVEAHAFY